MVYEKMFFFIILTLIFYYHCFEQQEGAAMGSPISPIVANIYEEFENKAIYSAPQPPPFLEKICG